VTSPEVFVVHEFSVRPADTADVDAALAAIVAHIRDEHPEILTCETYRQWVGSRPHRAYHWIEGFENLAAIDGGTATQACTDSWEPIYRLAQEGSILRSVWLAAPPELSMER
jgi:hypothetical protein